MLLLANLGALLSSIPVLALIFGAAAFVLIGLLLVAIALSPGG